MAEEDNFDDLDIYGDGNGEEYADGQENPTDAGNAADAQPDAAAENGTTKYALEAEIEPAYPIKDEALPVKQEQLDASMGGDTEQSSEQDKTQAIASTSGDTSQSGPPKQAPVQQGVKRKEGEGDEREISPDATSAVLVSDLHWYQDEDDVRGWCNQAGVEDEIKEITFNEHKVNGKSKGQVFVALHNPQAATALKLKLEELSSSGPASGPDSKQHTVQFHAPNNPYKTLPKENPGRRDQNTGGRGNFQGGRGNFNRGGHYNQRGGVGQGGFNQNRNFSNPGGMGGGFQGNNMGGGAMAGGFNAGMGMGNFNNFNRGGMMGGMNRGGMMNRGGRGGMMGMGGMGMGGMGGNMMGGGMMGGPMGGMGMGMGGMGMGGFGGAQQPHFNPAFFNNQQQGGMAGDWNNNPNKRQRQE